MKLKTFFEKFDQFADAPNAVAKMRELVRHLAVTGTLVDQDDNDEPALALLDRIAAYKTALAKEGKLRGPTTIAPMSPDEGTRVLPSSWTWVRFGEVMVNRDGERIPVSKEERATKAKTYDYYGASGVIDKIDGYLFDKSLLLIGEDGANLINRSTPIAFMARGQYWVNNHAHVLDGISEEFLRYIELHINAINLESYVTGSAQPKMNQAKMNSIPIGLPPLAEQERIVAKVDELMALCDRLEAQQQERDTRHAALARASLARFADAPTPTNLHFLFHKCYTIPPSDLRKSILTLAVQGKIVPQDPKDEPAEELLERVTAALPDKKSENPFLGKIETSITDESSYELPPGWAWLPLGHVGIWATGCGFPLQYQGETDGEFLFCKVSDMNLPGNEVEINTTVHQIDATVMKKIRARANPVGTVIFPKIGGAIATHKRRLVIKPTIIDNNCSGIQPIGLTDNRWLLLFLRNLDLTKYQSGTSVPAVSQGSLDPIRIGLPPLAEQRRIVAKVDQLMALVDELETQLAASRATAKNLLQALVAELTAA